MWRCDWQHLCQLTLNGVHTAASLLLFHSIVGHTRQNSKQAAAEAVSMRVWVRAPDTRQRCWPAAVQCLTHHRNLSSHMRHPPPVEHTQQTRTERTSSRHNRYTPAVNNGSHCRTTHTNTRLAALCPGLPGTRKVKPIWILMKQETVSGSGISLAMCKSAPCSRQITTPTLHHSVFYRLDALQQPTASKHWRHKCK